VQARPSRHLFLVACNDAGISSAPQGYMHYDTASGRVSTWYAGPRQFVCEAILVPKRREGGEGGELDAYLIGLVHDTEGVKGPRTSLCVFDAAALEKGPVCRLWLHRLPWGLHCQFAEDLTVQEPPREARGVASV
jgi:carotenoid cleavage dioxygenase-like enzyme